MPPNEARTDRRQYRRHAVVLLAFAATATLPPPTGSDVVAPPPDGPEHSLVLGTATPRTSPIRWARAVTPSGQHLVCDHDKVSDALDNGDSDGSDEAAVVGSDEMSNRAKKLVADHHGHCIYYLQGWWTYKYCIGVGITQYHVEDGRQIDPNLPPEFVLGNFDIEVDEPTQRSFLHYYDDGTACDGTDLRRHTTVSFGCSEIHPELTVISLEEPRTCRYEMVVAAASLCSPRHTHRVVCAPDPARPGKPQSALRKIMPRAPDLLPAPTDGDGDDYTGADTGARVPEPGDDGEDIDTPSRSIGRTIRYKYERGWDYWGLDIGSTTAATPEQCALDCRADRRCKAFTHAPIYNRQRPVAEKVEPGIRVAPPQSNQARAKAFVCYLKSGNAGRRLCNTAQTLDCLLYVSGRRELATDQSFELDRSKFALFAADVEWQGTYVCQGVQHVQMMVTSSADVIENEADVTHVTTTFQAIVGFQHHHPGTAQSHTNGSYLVFGRYRQWLDTVVLAPVHQSVHPPGFVPIHFALTMVAGGPEATMFGVARSCLNGPVQMKRFSITQATERCHDERCVVACDGWDKGQRTHQCMMDLWLMAGCSPKGQRSPWKKGVSEQIAYWRKLSLVKMLADMRGYKRFADKNRNPYPIRCLGDKSGHDSVSKGPAMSGSIRRLLVPTEPPIPRFGEHVNRILIGDATRGLIDLEKESDQATALMTARYVDGTTANHEATNNYRTEKEVVASGVAAHAFLQSAGADTLAVPLL